MIEISLKPGGKKKKTLKPKKYKNTLQNLENDLNTPEI